MAIECIPPEVLDYQTGSFVVRFGINNAYETTKSCKIQVYRCDDPQCTTGQLVGESDPFDVPPGQYNIELNLTIEQSGYYAIVVHNITDNVQECGFVISVRSPMEQMTYAMMAMMPMMFMIPMAGAMISMATEITEKVGE